MSRASLLELLRQRIGLDGDSLGARIVDDACAEARRTLEVADDLQLLRRMQHDPVAFAAAAEHFLGPESWFFRAPEQFDDLVRFAREQRDRRPLRVLSLPCASGEEAYSAVIRLLEAGLAQTAPFRALRYFVSAGERMPPQIWTAWEAAGGHPILDGLGCSECVYMIIGNAPVRLPASHARSSNTGISAPFIAFIAAAGRTGDGGRRESADLRGSRAGCAAAGSPPQSSRRCVRDSRRAR